MECGGKKILVDCGLQQGRDERDNQELDFAAGYIDAVVVTHAHIDHSGRMPLLVKQGFTGHIYCTRLTGQLLSIMLRDSAHIQESDAQWQNQKGKRAGEAPVEPLYTVHDAEEALKQLVTCEYGQSWQIADGVKVRFVDAGHLLGSASVELWLTEGDTPARWSSPATSATGISPSSATPSTSGGRLCAHREHLRRPAPRHGREPDYTADLAAIIDETLGKGGNVIIPSFAVGRTQELLYFIREMKEQGLVKRVPNFSVVVDSPLAGEATRIFSGDLHGYLDEEAIAALKGGALFHFPGLTITESSEESKALNLDKTPKVIISASGMCDAGRIRHHLKHNLWRPECAVVFVGYQAEGSLGRRLLNGVGLGQALRRGDRRAGADRQLPRPVLPRRPGRPAALDRALQPPAQAGVCGPRRPGGHRGLRQHPAGAGLPAHAPNYEEVYDLLDNQMLAPGLPPEKKPEPACRRLAGLPAPGGCGPQAHGGHRPQQGRHQQGSGPGSPTSSAPSSRSGTADARPKPPARRAGGFPRPASAQERRQLCWRRSFCIYSARMLWPRLR